MLFIIRRASIVQMQYKLDKLDGEKFELQARLEKFEYLFLLNSEKLNGFQRILDGFLVSFGQIHIVAKFLIVFFTFQNGFGDKVQIKEATANAIRNRHSSKPSMITCDVEIHDIQKKIERRTM